MLLICLAVLGSSALCLSFCPSLKSNWPAAEVKPTHQPLFPNHRVKSFSKPPESSRCPKKQVQRRFVCECVCACVCECVRIEEQVQRNSCWGGFVLTVAYWLDVSLRNRLRVTYSIKAAFCILQKKLFFLFFVFYLCNLIYSKIPSDWNE